MARPHIQVILADEAIPHSLRTALQRTGASAAFGPLSEALRGGHASAADATVVVVPEDARGIAGPLRVLFDRLAEQPRATLVLKSTGDELPPLEHPPTLPVTFFRGSDDHDLFGRLTAMLEMRHSINSLHRGLLANRRSEANIAKRYANQLRLASQLQREFLPGKLPRFGSASFNVVFRPVDYVSGDIYDVHRLDEEHVGIAVADATGHGIPAALLTVYIKRALRGKEIENGSYRILSPDEVLKRLNDDIMDAQLTECPFVAAVYAVLNIRTLEVCLARGGAPYPLLRTAAGQLTPLVSDGRVVGALPEACFDVLTVQLEAGDSLVFYSDGLERIVAPEAGTHEVPEELQDTVETAFDEDDIAPLSTSNEERAGAAVAVASSPRVRRADHSGSLVQTSQRVRGRALAGDELISGSRWYQTLQTMGTTVALQEVSDRQRMLRRMGYPLDDLTVLSLDISA